jgi:4-hydroxybenzoate polyprenyltransferase
MTDIIGHSGVLADILSLLRVRQWTKNLFCLAGVVFGGRYASPPDLATAALVFLSFCLAASAVYVGNDIHDAAHDRNHPKKRNRPISAGRISNGFAVVLMVACLIGSLVIAASTTWVLLAAILAYLANNVLYNRWLKRIAILDVLSITMGFVLRLLAGIYALNDIPTAWIVLCVFFLSSFLGFAKRRAELNGILERNPRGFDVGLQRPALAGYSVTYLDLLVTGTATMTVICYALFAAVSHKNPSLIVTVPFVFYAVMHYQRMLMSTAYGEEPETVALTDPHLVVTGGLWFITFMTIWVGQFHFFK